MNARMYKNEDFTQVGDIGKGELVLKSPKYDIRLPYSDGKLFVNWKGNIGYVNLGINDLIVMPRRDNGPQNDNSTIRLQEILEDSDSMTRLKQQLTTNPLPLFYSKIKEGSEVISMPGLGEEVAIGNSNFFGKIIGCYSITERLPNVEEVYQFHSSIIRGKRLIANKEFIKKELGQIVQKANGIYSQSSNFTSDAQI